MTRTRNWSSALLLALIAAVVLTACGGGESADSTPSDTGAPETTVATSEPSESTEPSGSTATTEGSTDTTGERPPFELGVIQLPLSEGAPEDLVAAAQAEGEVQWYTAASTFETIAEAFQEEYGISVVANRQNSGAITQLYMSEADAGAVVADVMQAFNPPLYVDAAEKGYFAPITPEEVPNLAKVPEELRSEFWAPSNSWVWGPVYNTQLVTEPLETWEDLLNPAFKGHIVMADPRLGGVTAAWVNWLHNTYGEEFLRALGEQDLQWVDSNVAALDRLAAGEVWIVIPTNKNNPDPLIEQGAPLQFVAPEESSWFSHDVAISADAPHPNAARLFANYLFSLEVQEGVAFAGPPVRPDARSDIVMLPTWDQLVPEDVEEGVSRLDQWIEWLQIDG